MRIGINLMFLVASKGGGIERHVRGLLRGLHTVGGDHEYVLFTNRHCKGTFPLAPNMREVVSDVSAEFRPAKTLWEQGILPFQLRQHAIDVVLSPANIGPIITGLPSAVIIHDVIPFRFPEVFTTTERVTMRTLFRLSARSSDAILTVSESSKRDIAALFGVAADKIRVVPGAVDERFHPVTLTDAARATLTAAGIPSSYILYVAAARAHKNLEGLIRAYRLLVDRHRISQALVIVGSADRASPSALKLVDELGLADRIVFTGFLDDAVLPTLYSAADVFVYPSFYEGFGLPVIEAMACGVPVAASNRTALPEAVGDAGHLFDPDRIENMADVIHGILASSDERAALSRKGLARANLFTWETTATRTLAVLTEIAGKA